MLKVSTKGPMTISMLFGMLMTYSLSPGASRSFECLLSRDNLSILYVGMIYSVDFSILVEFDDGLNVNVLLFGLIVRVFRI
jgi:hypothetical protein